MILLRAVAFICFDLSARFSHIGCVSINWRDLVVTDYPLSVAVYTECNQVRTVIVEMFVQLDVLIRLVIRSGK